MRYCLSLFLALTGIAAVGLGFLLMFTGPELNVRAEQRALFEAVCLGLIGPGLCLSFLGARSLGRA
jgi:hypothetical protein